MFANKRGVVDELFQVIKMTMHYFNAVVLRFIIKFITDGFHSFTKNTDKHYIYLFDA